MSLEGRHLGEFEILERLGQGGMGAVYKARQTSIGRFVAIKTLQASLADDMEYIARFQQEARAAGVLNHPNLVQVYSAGESEGLHWFAMEYVEGESAKVRLKRKGRLDPLEAIAIVLHVATALEYGWRKAQLIHRDIKPDNIFLSCDGEVKLGDLGLAKSVGQTQGLTVTGASMGTPHYISPEQVMAAKDVDLRADIYSLGCTLFHLLSGRPPFEGNSAVAVMMKHVHDPVPDLCSAWPECPPELASVVGKMMRKAPEERQQNYEEVIVDLRLAYDVMSNQDAPTMAAPDPTPQPHATPAASPTLKPRALAATPQPKVVAVAKPASPQKSKLPLFAAVAVVVLAIVGVCVFVFRPKEEKLAQAERRAKDHPGSQAAASSPETATKETPFVNGLGVRFVPVPITGGPTNGQRVLFSIWDTRVQDYEGFVKETKREWQKPDLEQGPTHPAVMVSWDDAAAFCAWLTEREHTSGRLPANNEYRLPSDHEWSCAVGIGDREDTAKLPFEKNGKLTDQFPWGAQWPPPNGAGNYAGVELQATLATGKYTFIKGVIAGYNDGFVNTSPVESFGANRFGIFDISGNVQQWCEDWYDKDQKERVVRGGSWADESRGALLSSGRYHYPPAYRNLNYGFRCVIAPMNASAVTGPTRASATKETPFVNTLGMKFVPVPIVSGPSAGQRVLFSVWDTRVQDYAVYAGANKVDDSWTKQNKDGVPAGQELKHPVVGVSWEDAQAFCKWLTEKEIAEGKLPKGMKYRLPSDEEWSWAVGLPPELGATPSEKSGKNSVDFPWGKDYPPRGKVGNYADEAYHAKFPPKKNEKENRVENSWIEGYNDGYATTSPVASFPANAYGLYDMGGNVWQWCEDWYDASHEGCVLRGASWDGLGRGGLLSSSRLRNPSTVRGYDRGFRCVVGVSAL